jgi:CubicO group peptidase (beta-lactamase class C family)
MNRSYVDSIYYNIYSSDLLKKKEYKYSDLAYYLFYKFIEGTLNKPFYSYLYQNYYQPMGTTSLGFLPLNRFSKDRIIPTENDVVYRRQLLHGYVHDPGAAMMGGIAGHAGLFSNANDLAKFMQMYLNGGTYGGKEYISPETLKTFTTSWYRGNENRRGLGFDKPEIDKDKEGPTFKDISPKSFGHSGFTGTIAWADPETGIVYIFLSNRIHPNQDNLKLVEMDVRTNIQQAIYEAIIKGGGGG